MRLHALSLGTAMSATVRDLHCRAKVGRGVSAGIIYSERNEQELARLLRDLYQCLRSAKA